MAGSARVVPAARARLVSEVLAPGKHICCVLLLIAKMNSQLPFVMFAIFAGCARSMEPLAILAAQPVWQAGEPMKVTMDYDGAEFYAFTRAHAHRAPRIWCML